MSLISLTVLINGCATPNAAQNTTSYTKVYEGPDLDKSEIATVSGAWQNRNYVEIQTVDGKNLCKTESKSCPFLIHILPGKHVLVVGMATNDFPIEREPSNQFRAPQIDPYKRSGLSFEAFAGHEYAIKFKKWIDLRLFGQVTGISFMDIRFWIEDLKSGEVVSQSVPLAQNPFGFPWNSSRHA